jgi:hypothetical protein
MTLQAVKGGWVAVRKTVVNHWTFHNGIDPINPGNQFGETVLPRSWTCWVYPYDDHEFEEWMSRMCPTADCTRRFNSGDPMTTVTITDDTEATLFTLKYGNGRN